jgi:hypothetical protein
VNYFAVGKAGLMEYFSGHPSKMDCVVQPGKTAIIDPAMDSAIVTTNELVHGIYEFQIDQPATVYVLQRDPGQKTADAVSSLPQLSCKGGCYSGAGRGRFVSSEFAVKAKNVIDTASLPVRIILADGKKDRWIQGVDSIDQTNVLNHGNYGAMYHVQLKWKSSDGYGLALLAMAHAGSGDCSFQAMTVEVGENGGRKRIVELPKKGWSYGPQQGVLIRRFSPAKAGDVSTLDITFSPPGASCLPAPILLVPLR